MPFACLPWYPLAETSAAQAAFWSFIARRLREHGVPRVPRRLVEGRPVTAAFADPGLLFGQCCGYDVIYGFGDSLVTLATPVYTAPGCEGPHYRSFVLVREDTPADDLEGLRGLVCAVNGHNSHSGTNALRALVAPLSANGRFFGRVLVSGSHLDSLSLLVAGRADVMAMDCVLHALLRAHRPDSLAGTRILCRTEAVPAPPFVTSSATSPLVAGILVEALREALLDPRLADARAAMLLGGAERLPREAYSKIIRLEGEAIRLGYTELHAVNTWPGGPLSSTPPDRTGPAVAGDVEVSRAGRCGSGPDG